MSLVTLAGESNRRRLESRVCGAGMEPTRRDPSPPPARHARTLGDRARAAPAAVHSWDARGRVSDMAWRGADAATDGSRVSRAPPLDPRFDACTHGSAAGAAHARRRRDRGDRADAGRRLRDARRRLRGRRTLASGAALGDRGICLSLRRPSSFGSGRPRVVAGRRALACPRASPSVPRAARHPCGRTSAGDAAIRWHCGARCGALRLLRALRAARAPGDARRGADGRRDGLPRDRDPRALGCGAARSRSRFGAGARGVDGLAAGAGGVRNQCSIRPSHECDWRASAGASAAAGAGARGALTGAGWAGVMPLTTASWRGSFASSRRAFSGSRSSGCSHHLERRRQRLALVQLVVAQPLPRCSAASRGAGSG